MPHIRIVAHREGEILMANAHLKLVTPAIANGTVPPRRRPNKELRTREYLTPDEVERLLEALRGNRHGQRDAAMALIAYRHGLRAAELVDLRWSQIDFDNARLHVKLLGSSSTRIG
jgi:type 1 fimbriae regulatory protein FimB/type 1 fimbriae regulatory protein FimE